MLSFYFLFVDVGSFQEMIEKFQRQVSHTRVFGNGITKERRLEIFEILKDIQKNVSCCLMVSNEDTYY